MLIREALFHFNIILHLPYTNTENGHIYSIKDFLSLYGLLYNMNLELAILSLILDALLHTNKLKQFSTREYTEALIAV